MGMVSLTLTPFAPWHAAHTVAALALPASISAACATGATARMMYNPSTFFTGFSISRLAGAAYGVFGRKFNTLRGRIIPALLAPVRSLGDGTTIEPGSLWEYGN